jgi:phage terminase large subunit-like protein
MANIKLDPKTQAAVEARLRKMALRDCFDAADLSSRPNAKQWEIFNDIGKIRFRWVICSNQAGKSASGAREVAWVLNDNHPFWTRPSSWKDEPLLVIVAGKGRDMMETELWAKKLKPLLIGDWREVRRQAYLVSAINNTTGDKIIFIPHGDGSDRSIDLMQSYVAHYVWCDEMPERAKVLSELQMRTQSRQGYFLATFTPLAVSSEIKNMVESADGILSKRYRMTMFDNPLYKGREQEILSLAQTWPVRERSARLNGDWYQSDNAVYEADRKDISMPLPSNYSKDWDHFLSADPAGSSNTGCILAANDPATNITFVIRATYIREKDPQILVQKVEEVASGCRVVKRMSDVNPFFVSTAYRLGHTYIQPYKKTERKMELIKNLQTELSQGRLKMVIGNCDDLLDELETCRFAENGEERIVHSQRFHLLDALQYLVDIKPKTSNTITISSNQTWADQILVLHEKHKKYLQNIRITNSSRRRRRL